MSRVLVTGSADGLGRLAAQSLLRAGHQVVVHARNPERATTLDALLARGADLVTGDFADLLTALLPGPRRLVYLSSSSHYGGRASADGIDWEGHRAGSYDDSKLFVTTLAAAAARLRPRVLSNAVDPGWVPTRMGGIGAPDDLDLGSQTQEWLATSDDAPALTSGGYWYHRERRRPHLAVTDHAFQDRLLQALAEETGTRLAEVAPR